MNAEHLSNGGHSPQYIGAEECILKDITLNYGSKGPDHMGTPYAFEQLPITMTSIKRIEF